MFGLLHHPLTRAITIITAAIVLLTGITFAAMQSQNAVLQGNSITSATANLLIGDSAGNYAASVAGFSFSNVEPGSYQPSTGGIFTLRNAGTSTLQLHIGLNPTHFTNQNNANLDRIFIGITPVTGGARQEFSLANLIAAYNAGSYSDLNLRLPGDSDQQFKLQVFIGTDAVASSAQQLTLTGIDLVFNGQSVASV